MIVYNHLNPTYYRYQDIILYNDWNTTYYQEQGKNGQRTTLLC